MVPFPKTCAGRLAAEFNGTVRVYPFGVAGSPMSQYLAFAEYARDNFRPDGLVIVIVDNDYKQSGFLAAPFEAVLQRLADAPRLGLDYAVAFRPWREIFGDRLTVYPMEAARMPQGLLASQLAHFLTVIGAAELAPAAALLARKNERPGAKCLEVLRLTAQQREGRLYDRRARRRSLQVLSQRVPGLLDSDVPFAGLTRAQVDAVTEQFAEANSHFARVYGVARGVLFQSTLLEDGMVRPSVGAWKDFSETERIRVGRFVRDAVGVDLSAPRRSVRSEISTMVRNLSGGTAHCPGSTGRVNSRPA